MISELATVIDPAVQPQVFETEVECVPLSVFTRAGKRGHYEQCGLITLFDTADHSDVVGDVQCNFTHRTSHGATDDADAATGKYSSLAADALVRLQGKYPEVFSEPVYPVDRSNCPQ